jgi:hypothetical protein
MAFEGFVSLGRAKMDGNGSAPLTQKVKEHQRLFHTVGSDHTDALLLESADRLLQSIAGSRIRTPVVSAMISWEGPI